MIKSITVKELKELIDKKESFHLIDVREPYELENGTIPTSINIPLEDLPEKLKSSNFSKEDKLIFYCRTGGRSRVATEIAISLGFVNSINLVGGIYSWSDIDNNVKKY